MPTFPILTERLALRPFTLDDADDHFAYFRLPEVARYVPWEPGTREQAQAQLQRRIGQSSFHDAEALNVAAVLPATGRVIGEFMLRLASRADGQAEIGFAMHPDYQGQGYAYEAAHTLLRIAFSEFGMHRVFGGCDSRNVASARLLSRLGMRQEAHLRQNEFFKGEWTDELIFAVLVTEFVP